MFAWFLKERKRPAHRCTPVLQTLSSAPPAAVKMNKRNRMTAQRLKRLLGPKLLSRKMIVFFLLILPAFPSRRRPLFYRTQPSGWCIRYGVFTCLRTLLRNQYSVKQLKNSVHLSQGRRQFSILFSRHTLIGQESIKNLCINIDAHSLCDWEF